MTKLVLGTAQFGLKYGINNKTGKLSKPRVHEILKYAYDKGIKYFDVANAYGNAEEILGEFIEKNKLKNKISIISKLKPNILDGYKGKLGKLIEGQINLSLSRLKIDSLKGYLLHTPEYIYNNEVIRILKKIKKKGLIKNFGVSTYNEKEAVYAALLPVDFIQVPYNVFDQRLDKTDFFTIAKKNKVKIFARSPFVQGLVLMKNEEIPKHLNETQPYLKIFDKIIKRYSLTRLEAALLFSYNNKNLDHVVIGVDNLGQLKEAIRITSNFADPIRLKECFIELNKKFRNVKGSFFIPSLWQILSKRKRLNAKV